MHDDELKRIAQAATTDQAAEAWSNTARLVARYHATLRAEKVPSALAGDLTMTMAEMLLARTLWPDEVSS